MVSEPPRVCFHLGLEIFSIISDATAADITVINGRASVFKQETQLLKCERFYCKQFQRSSKTVKYFQKKWWRQELHILKEKFETRECGITLQIQKHLRQKRAYFLMLAAARTRINERKLMQERLHRSYFLKAETAINTLCQTDQEVLSLLS